MAFPKGQTPEPIYESARTCLALFDEYINDEDLSDQAFAFVEEVRGQFKTWAAYIGAFAAPRASLDARLSTHDEIRDMVLDLLKMLEDNMNWVRENESWEPKAAEKHLEDPEHFLGTSTVKSTLERLFTLAISIRRSSRQSHAARQPNESGTSASSCLRLLEMRYPNARKSLLDQLARSVHSRGVSLQHTQSHNEKLAQQRKPLINMYQDAIEEEALEPKENFAPVPCRNRHLVTDADTAPSRISPSTIIRQHKVGMGGAKPSRSIISTGSTVRDLGDDELPYPPVPKRDTETGIFVCMICYEPLGSSPVTGKAWKKHVDRDLQHYVCISEQCKEPLQFFARNDEWELHMQIQHTKNWAHSIHTETWHCDLDHPEPLDFETKNEFLAHLKEEHNGKLTSSQMNGRARRNRIVATREPSVCPFCDCVPDDIKPLTRKSPCTDLTSHIEMHLKYASFFSLSYLDLELGDDEIIASLPTDSSDRELGRTSLSVHNFNHAFASEESEAGDSEGSIYQDCEEHHSDNESVEDWSFVQLKPQTTDWEVLQKGLHRSAPITNKGPSTASRPEFNIPDYKLKPFDLPGAPDTRSYVDRPTLRALLEEHLLPGSKMYKSIPSGAYPIVCLFGTYGVGKSQLAADFARRYGNEFTSVFWIDARSEQLMKHDIALIEADGEESNNKFSDAEVDFREQTMLEWLSTPANRGWLMIFDDVDGQQDMDGSGSAFDWIKDLPFEQGTILTTSRYDYSRRISDCVVLEVDGGDEALAEAIFLNWYNMEPGHECEGVISLLSGQPLALTHAASYLNHTKFSVESYAERILQRQSRVANCFDWFRELSVGLQLTLTTWLISTDHIHRIHPTAYALLRSWAFLDQKTTTPLLINLAPDYESTLTEKGFTPSSTLPYRVGGRCDLASAIVMLLGYSMIEADRDSARYFQMHALEHRYSVLFLSDRGRITYSRLALEVQWSHSTEAAARRGIMRSLKWYQKGFLDLASWKSDKPEVLRAINRLGRFLSAQGKLGDAKELHSWVIKNATSADKILLPIHDDAMDDLAEIHWKAAEYPLAAELWEAMLLTDPNSPETECYEDVKTVTKLAKAYMAQDQLDEAERILQGALEECDKHDEACNQEVFGVLGNVYHRMGKVKEAKKLRKRARAHAAKSLG
ncbi:hypothetical protein FZEAL_615 [Fusarium zealandicum]|uniref:NB-ARC domain-containing protein n=1 Tax=Fusarium zealandicum TaxID=1053134 RepID=A0A8H4XPK4_9HYPO|nr:hypothetical protein FZEAL_615 [Fusarium zealandicum]